MSWNNSDTTVLMTTQRKSSLKGGSWPWDNHLSSPTWLEIPTQRALIRYLPSSMTAWKSSCMNVPVSSCVLPFHASLMRGALGRCERFPTAELPKEHTGGKGGENGQGWNLGKKVCIQLLWMLDWERKRLTRTHSGNVPSQKTVQGCGLSQRPDYVLKFIKLRAACFRFMFFPKKNMGNMKVVWIRKSFTEQNACRISLVSSMIRVRGLCWKTLLSITCARNPPLPTAFFYIFLVTPISHNTYH